MSDSDSDFSDDFSDDPELEMIRRKRMEQLKELQTKQAAIRFAGQGNYVEVKEADFLPSVTQSKYVLCHFFHENFDKCKQMHVHLSELAKEHPECKFINLNAEKAKFFVEKLMVRVLPTIVLFEDGVAKERVTGFEGIGTSERISRRLLTRWLARQGGIHLPDFDPESDDEDEGY